MVKNLSLMLGTWVRSLGQEEPLEIGSPFQFSCLENPMDQRSLVGHSSWGHKRVRHD